MLRVYVPLLWKNEVSMKIENSKYILYFFSVFFFGSVASNQNFISLCEITDSFGCEKHQSTFCDDSQDQNKDLYRRTYQSQSKIKDNKFVYVTPHSAVKEIFDKTLKANCSKFDDIAIGLTIKDLIYPFNYFL